MQITMALVLSARSMRCLHRPRALFTSILAQDCRCSPFMLEEREKEIKSTLLYKLKTVYVAQAEIIYSYVMC